MTEVPTFGLSDHLIATEPFVISTSLPVSHYSESSPSKIARWATIYASVGDLLTIIVCVVRCSMSLPQEALSNVHGL